MRDIDVRIALREKILSRYYADDSSRVIEEMGIFQGISRIDIAVVNGSLYGYEIKSESDTLYRFDSQLHYYRQVFDYLTFVVSVKHEDSVRHLLPNWCGLITASVLPKTGSIYLNTKIRPKKNPEINAIAIAQLLWKDELLYILNEKGLKKGLSKKNKRDLWELAARTFTTKELSSLTRQLLKERKDWRVD